MTPLTIGAYNFMLSMLPWFPAVFVFFQISFDLNDITEIRYPGYDNSHLRTIMAAGSMTTAFLAFALVWWSGLLLTESFRCAFS